MNIPEDTAKGARAMYEAELAKANKLGFVGCPWEELEQAGRDHWIDSFSAGLASIPDHSAELLEALEAMLAELDRDEGEPWSSERLIAGIRLGRAAIAKARARKGGVA